MLENNTLTLDEAYKQARALEQAQTQAASYNTGTVASINIDNMKISEAPPLQDNIENVAAIQSNPSDPCYFWKTQDTLDRNVQTETQDVENVEKKAIGQKLASLLPNL